ncbi:hypothetical protein [Corynebacterium pygosceleis]|uniref:Uncharacterized protein n=1 Tax=Corynebacterium pygosceleis TaxID=2800406 RepID=A0A9Q4GI30_9CORY|nr:hypothetical protein [Corynebacterium pygosceleis]MCK7637013.1 hypothetical protein [Corynebacterium pygosceleis]MCK7674487.1 hypothetical protein [Corynebacterium pygosceleis]MCL0120215.1 hypothetical protein [Corynebacterium pygosceleis]MCX7443762.1 hypothetical protein [Corynebacterium pygosceleis]MCX7467766.1 hypothetical protein [Corynebacterium pygosceleis]
MAQPQNCDHPHPVDPVMIAREMNLTVSEIADSAQMRVTARISTHPEMFGTVGETVTFTIDGVERTAVVDSNFEAGVVFTPKPGGGMITASLPMHVEEGGLTYVSDAHAEIHYAADDVDEPPMSGGVGSMFQAIIAWFRSLFAGSS